jgi:hypothetical protein
MELLENFEKKNFCYRKKDSLDFIYLFIFFGSKD